MQPFTEEVVAILQVVPEGTVATYGQIAAIAGNPRGARQVVRVLHSMSSKYNLPWHRIINSKGKIAIADIDGREEQRARLQAEGIVVSDSFTIDLSIYQWQP